MSYLKEKILKDGVVLNNNVLKVDSFLNHQIDPTVLKEISNEFIDYFKDKEITKVMTIEASGIAPAILVASHLDVPMLFAKKTEPSTLSNEDQFATNVHSFTKNKTSRVLVSKQYLSEDDKVLIIDDFLANGEAALGLIDLVEQAEAKVVGVGICVEKSFQPGRAKLEEKGVDIFSICRVASLENNEITFVEEGS
ncbi:xanthine phosphoribosyltransferase [Carnobacteriaceae bacterium 52-44]|jgi:xanthine phosphoribosyltransferase